MRLLSRFVQLYYHAGVSKHKNDTRGEAGLPGVK